SEVINPVQNIGGPCSPRSLELNPVIALGPEHAEFIASRGWTRAQFQQALWEKARIPLSTWPASSPQMHKFTELYGPVTGESLIPITLKPEGFLVIVAGGAGKHSHYFPPFPGCFAVSRLVGR
ncbi:MAG: hypothetical protein V1737_02350, partial [Chloroflexota bacterium]